MHPARAKPSASAVLIATLLAAVATAGETPAPQSPSTTGPEILYAPLMMDYYTPALRQAGEQGKVRFKVCIDAAGGITTAEMLESSGSVLLDQTATRLVREYRFKAGTEDGVPTGSCFGIPILFMPYGTPPAAGGEAAGTTTPIVMLTRPDLRDYYPTTSLMTREEGTVRVRLCFDVKGLFTSATVSESSGFRRLDDAGLRAAEKFRFKPGTLNGLPQAGCVIVPMTFRVYGL